MTIEQIASIGGVVLSLVFSFFPVVKDWYARQASNVKRYVMVGVLFAIVAGAFGLNCADVYSVGWACDWPGARDALMAFVAAVVANQATFLITPKRNG